MMDQEAVKEYTNMERSDTGMSGNLKSECACANICVYYDGLAYRYGCMDSAKSAQRWTLVIDRRHFDAMALGDPLGRDSEFPGSDQRISGSTRAWSDGEKPQMLSSEKQKMDTR